MGGKGFKTGKCIPVIWDDSVCKETPTHLFVTSFALAFNSCLKLKS